MSFVLTSLPDAVPLRPPPEWGPDLRQRTLFTPLHREFPELTQRHVECCSALVASIGQQRRSRRAGPGYGLALGFVVVMMAVLVGRGGVVRTAETLTLVGVTVVGYALLLWVRSCERRRAKAEMAFADFLATDSARFAEKVETAQSKWQSLLAAAAALSRRVLRSLSLAHSVEAAIRSAGRVRPSDRSLQAHSPPGHIVASSPHLTNAPPLQLVARFSAGELMAA